LLVPKILHKLIVTESWPATEFATRLRKRGCGIILITQSPSNIERDIIKNTSTKIAFRLQDPEDIRIIAEAAGFTDIAEYEYLADNFVKLPKKVAIVCASEHEPFLMTAADFEPAPFQIDTPPQEPEQEEQEELQVDERKFLESIEKEPFLSVTERRVSLGWNDRKYSKIVDVLLKKRKIERFRVRLGRGSPKILYQIPGKVPSVKHEYYVNWIAGSLKAKGFNCKKHSEGPDIEIPEIKTAIEVELGKSNMHGNLRNDVQKFDRVIVCSDEDKVIEGLSKENKDRKILFLPIHKVPAVFEKMQAGNDFVNI